MASEPTVRKPLTMSQKRFDEIRHMLHYRIEINATPHSDDDLMDAMAEIDALHGALADSTRRLEVAWREGWTAGRNRRADG